MSAGKFLTGTTLTAPAIGGGGYIAYSELTKEKDSRSQEENLGSSDVKGAEAPVEGEIDSKDNTGGDEADDKEEKDPKPDVQGDVVRGGESEEQSGPTEDKGSGSAVPLVSTNVPSTDGTSSDTLSTVK